jgi:hypothetical protein
MVDLERIIWRTSKIFVFGNGYNIVLAEKPVAASRVAVLPPAMAVEDAPRPRQSAAG